MLNPEDALIPYQASDLPAGPWLVFAPHADDETFGMGGSLLRARDEQVQTHVVVLTDGALGGAAENLVETRRSEVEQATEMLGVASLQCWSEPDRGLRVSDALAHKAAHAITDCNAASVFFPAALELHPDHRNTALLVWQALQELSKAGVAPHAYTYEIGVQSPVNVLIDVSSQWAEKEKVMEVYVSQNNELGYIELVRSLDKARTLTLPAQTSFAEGFYHYSSAQLQQPFYQAFQSIVAEYGR